MNVRDEDSVRAIALVVESDNADSESAQALELELDAAEAAGTEGGVIAIGEDGAGPAADGGEESSGSDGDGASEDGS
jgi:hypothetical protein